MTMSIISAISSVSKSNNIIIVASIPLPTNRKSYDGYNLNVNCLVTIR